MAGALNMAFPSSRVLAGWWKQLLPTAPQAVWVGHLFLQRVEALVHLVASQPLDQLNHLLLQAIRLEQAGAATPPMLDRLEARLHFPPAILNQLLRNLSDLGLVRHENGSWHLTESGETSLQSMQFPHAKIERHVFSFLERLDPSGQRQGDPLFLPLPQDRYQTWHPPQELLFRFEWLQSCQTQSPQWKRAHGFPDSLDKIVLPGADLKDWQNVVVLRPERMVAVLVQNAHGLQAFLAKPDGWTLATHPPLFTLDADVSPAYAHLIPEPTAEDLRRAWQHLAESHHLSTDETTAADVALKGLELNVRVPEPVLARLRLHRDDCVLVGEGCVRRLVRVVVGA